MTGYSEEYVKGFNAAKAMAEGCVQDARSGEADNDLRSIIYQIQGLHPQDQVHKAD